MPAKAKPPFRPAPKPRWQDRAVKSVRANPLLTWSSVASVVAVIGGLWTGGDWFFSRFQLAAAAELANKQIRSEIEQQAKESKQFHSEALAGQQNILTTILRNSLTACEKSAKKILACEEEKRAYEEASKRNEILFRGIVK